MLSIGGRRQEPIPDDASHLMQLLLHVPPPGPASRPFAGGSRETANLTALMPKGDFARGIPSTAHKPMTKVSTVPVSRHVIALRSDLLGASRLRGTLNALSV
jgi:hypothetical protein